MPHLCWSLSMFCWEPLLIPARSNYYEPLQYLFKWHKNPPSKLTPNDPHKNWGAFLDSGLPYHLPAVCRDNTQRLLPLWTFKKRRYQTKGWHVNVSSLWCQESTAEKWARTTPNMEKGTSHFFRKATWDTLGTDVHAAKKHNQKIKMERSEKSFVSSFMCQPHDLGASKGPCHEVHFAFLRLITEVHYQATRDSA